MIYIYFYLIKQDNVNDKIMKNKFLLNTIFILHFIKKSISFLKYSKTSLNKCTRVWIYLNNWYSVYYTYPLKVFEVLNINSG